MISVDEGRFRITVGKEGMLWTATLQVGKMNIVVEDDIEERFRRTVANTKGFRKGNISIALQEAIELWIKEQTRRKSSKDGE